MSVISLRLLAHEFPLAPGRVILVGANDDYDLWRLVNSGDLLMIDKKNRARYAGPSSSLIELAEAVERDHGETLEVLL